jgi:hypothetical protein
MVYMDDNQPMTITLTYGEWLTIRAILSRADITGYAYDPEQLRQAILNQNRNQLVP